MFGAVVTGKVPTIIDDTTGIITLSNRNNIYTTSIDSSGNYRFQDVAAGVYTIKSEIVGYNQTNTVTVDVSTVASAFVPELAIEKYTSVASNYSYTWIQDQSYAGLPKTETTQNIVKPVTVNVTGKAYQIADVSYSQELFDKYGIALNNSSSAWTQEYAYRLFVVLGRIPQISGTDYKYNSSLTPTIWTLTSDAIAGDIEVNANQVRISTAAFTYAAPLVVEVDGVRGLYFSKRLHHALVNFVTKGGSDQAAVAKILAERFGLTIDTDANRLNYALFTSESPTRFQNWFKHPAEIVDIINNFEELPEGMHKISGFKWLVRRLDGTVNPVNRAAPAIAWSGGYMEFMEAAFKNFDASYISKLILHEKAHYIYQFILTTAFKKEWANIGGWQYAVSPNNINYDAVGGWQTTKTTEFVSAYAHDKNPNEDFAESVAAFVANPDILKARSTAKYNFIRDVVMLSNSYVSVIRPDLTFQVLNLYPSYDYPGKIKRVSTTVTGAAEEDKTLTVEIEITPFSVNSNPVANIFARILSPVSVLAPNATYFDMQFSPVNKDRTVFRGKQTLSKHLRSGYWQMPNVRIVDSVGLERYESSLLYGFKCYINNPLEDTIAPQVQPKSVGITLRNGTLAGRPVQIATVKFNVIENTGLTYHYASLVPPNSYSLQQYGTGTTSGSGERTIEFYIREYAPSGRYTINQIALKDYGLNLNYTYFKTSSGNSDGTTVNLDEDAPSIDIVALRPDTTAPELDVNRVTIKSTPTNVASPDGETLVTIEYFVRDDISGYGSGSYIKLRDPQGIEHSYPAVHRNWSTDYFEGDPKAWEKYTMQVILPRGSAPGTWGLSQMTLIDKAGQMKSYSFTEIIRFDPSGQAISKASDLLFSTTTPTANSVASVVPSAAPRLSNLSVRAALEANQNVIVGLTMSGGSKPVLLRAAGPTLTSFGVPNAMSDPKIELYKGTTKINSNDNWYGSSQLSSVFQSTGAFSYTSNTSLDAALLTTIDGSYTVQASGSTAGTVLVEAYDAGTGEEQRFTNTSVRSKVGTGSNVLIVGFTLTGNGTRKLLIRAVGPKLSDFGVSGVLVDPKLELYSGTVKIAENDNWDSSLATTFTSIGAFSLNTGSKDAALTTTLSAGSYTVQVTGVNANQGEAVVEIYELP